jgi:hypothetical protein
MEPNGEIEQSVFLRVQFRNEDAAYYQFHVFPSPDSTSNICMARLRNGDSQYMQVFFFDAEDFAEFERNLHGNPHVIAVTVISEQEFLSKRSEAV